MEMSICRKTKKHIEKTGKTKPEKKKLVKSNLVINTANWKIIVKYLQRDGKHKKIKKINSKKDKTFIFFNTRMGERGAREIQLMGERKENQKTKLETLRNFFVIS